MVGDAIKSEYEIEIVVIEQDNEQGRHHEEVLNLLREGMLHHLRDEVLHYIREGMSSSYEEGV